MVIVHHIAAVKRFKVIFLREYLHLIYLLMIYYICIIHHRISIVKCYSDNSAKLILIQQNL